MPTSRPGIGIDLLHHADIEHVGAFRLHRIVGGTGGLRRGVGGTSARLVGAASTCGGGVKFRA